MLQDMIHQQQQDQLPIAQEEISSPISAQIFEFCESELFQETLQNSEVTSCSNCCYEDSSYPNAAAAAAICDTNNTKNAPLTATNSNLSIIFDSPEEIENDISASIDFTPSPTFSVPPHCLPASSQPDPQFDFSSLNPQIQLPADQNAVPFVGPPMLPVFEEDCLPTMPSYLRLSRSMPSCSAFLDPSVAPYLPPGPLNTALSAESSVLFSAGNSLNLGSELQPQELEYQGDNGGIYLNPGEIQGLSNESQQLVSGGGGSSGALASEITGLEDSTYKVGKLSVEQRKEKIHRYMKKRNERNFSKKIKYACRKTLADSRPRVRGRFAKNDEFGETPRASNSTHEDEDEDEVVVKEEDDMVDSTDIFAHISGVNSFNCNYSIQSWI